MRDKRWDVDFVGVLADEKEVQEKIGKNAVFINNTNSIQFYIKVVSERPYSFPQSIPWVTCFIDQLEPWGFEDDPLAAENERIDRVCSFLHDNLIVFHPEHRVRNDFKDYYVANDVYLIPKNPSFHLKLKLVPIPIFSEQLLKFSQEEFCSRLANRKYIGSNHQISHEEYDTPAFILWSNDQEELTIYGEFEKHAYAHGGFRFDPADKIRPLIMKPEWYEESYIYKNVLFVPKEVYEDIITSLPMAEPMVEFGSFDDVSFEHSNETTSENEYEKETLFMYDFIETTRKEGLFYNEKDLYNFHIAVKTGSLVILAGMSGTGKSKLVQVYAKTLGLAKEQFSLIPVRPSWTDDSDLIGYADTLNMVYRPGDSGLVNTLLRAEKEPDKLFLICFDEMNLARVEHYFSQFLSVLEMDEGRRVLRLYNDDLTNRFYNSAQYSPTVNIADNVMFVGTVNMDESTHHFSDKVLDRANLISLDVLPYNFLYEIEDKKKNIQKDPISKETYDQFKNQQRKIQLLQSEVDCLWDLHEKFQLTKKSMGIGPRIVRQIDRFLKNLPSQSPLSRNESFDLQIVQRILTKLRGPEELLSSLVGVYREDTQTVENSKILEVLADYPDVSDFLLTKQVIQEKAKELSLNGYTI